MRFGLSALAIVFVAVSAGCARDGRPQQPSSPRAIEKPANASHGRTLFEAQCAVCHGRDGNGGQIGPSLHNIHVRHSTAQIREAIVEPEPPMPKLFPARLSAADVHDLTAFVETL